MHAIGIVSALGFEAAAARRSPRFLVRRCGIGGLGAERAVGELRDRGCGVIVSWGTAGALTGDARNGDIYLADQVVTRDGGRIAADPDWRRRFTEAAAGTLVLKTGLLVSSPRIVATPANKRRLARSSGAGAVDMESDRIGAACAAARVPLLVVRCILDELEDRLPDPLLECLDRGGILRVAPLLAAVLRRPGQWAGMGRTARRYQRAKRNLSRAAGDLAGCG